MGTLDPKIIVFSCYGFYDIRGVLEWNGRDSNSTVALDPTSTQISDLFFVAPHSSFTHMSSASDLGTGLGDNGFSRFIERLLLESPFMYACIGLSLCMGLSVVGSAW